MNKLTEYDEKLVCEFMDNKDNLCSFIKEKSYIASNCLPELNLEKSKIRLIIKDLVYNHQKYTFIKMGTMQMNT